MPGRTSNTATAPRRRARKDADESGSVTVTQPRRKRPKLTEDTFTPPDDGEVIKQEETSSPLNGHNSTNSNSSRISIPHRGKSSAKSRSRLDLPNSFVLTKNPNYDVHQSRTFPDDLQISPTKAFNGSFSKTLGSVVALTRDKAYVWDYTSPASNTRVLSLPHPARTGDPLPLGVIVPGNAPAEVGLMVVIPNTGKITYWENVQDAHALGLFAQKRNGVEGTLGSLFSGETVINIETIGQAGYVFVLTSGRTAHVTLRDARSQAAVSATFLRAPSPHNGGGLFNSLRKAFISSGWLRDTVATKSRPSSIRGHVDVVIMNEAASFQTWQLGWSGQSSFGFEYDAKSELTSFVKAQLVETVVDPQVRALDFAMLPSPAEQEYQILILTAISAPSYSTFALVHLTLMDGDVTTSAFINLDSYKAPLDGDLSWRPSLIIPDTGSTGFVVFERAVVLVGMENLGEDHSGRHFQDTIYLKEDKGTMIVGAGASTVFPRCAVQTLVQGYGILSITTDVGLSENESRRTEVTAKDKIEQVIFYSMVPESPLNLSNIIDTKSTQEDVESAALDISNEIITSSTPHLAIPTSASMGTHLEHRAVLLGHLALHLKNGYPVLSRRTRWKLRWNGEKLAAAQKIWTAYDLITRNDEEDYTLLLPDVIDHLSTELRSEHDTSLEPGSTRHWFLKDVDKIQAILPACLEMCHSCFNMGKTVSTTVVGLQMVKACNEIAVDIYHTAWSFRTANAWLYNLEEEKVDDDLLTDGYSNLPEFWTSTYPAMTALLRLPLDSSGIVLEAYEHAQTSPDPIRITETSEKITKDLWQTGDVALKSCQERMRWAGTSTDPDIRQAAKEMPDLFNASRETLIGKLVDVGMSSDAIKLAQKYNDLKMLARVIRSESGYMLDNLDDPKITDADKKIANENIARLEGMVRKFSKKYGNDWTEEFYAAHIENKVFTGLLDSTVKDRSEITTFLRSKPGRKKLSWINDVIYEKDYKRAAKSLADVAVYQERDLWSKKVELSLAKLAALVTTKDKAQLAKEKLASSTSDEWNDIPKHMALTQPREQDNAVVPEEALELVNIEEGLYNHIAPTIYEAVDEVAEVSLAMENYGSVYTQDLPALHNLLQEGMSNLIGRAVLDVEQLLDVLTLMDIKPGGSDTTDIAGIEIYLALRALRYSGLATRDQERYETLLGTIWRRCYLKDKWEEINSRSEEDRSDEELNEYLMNTVLFQTFSEGFNSALFSGPSPIPILEPTSELVLHAGTKSADHHARFSSDELTVPIARDNAVDSSRLQVSNETCRLRQWFEKTRDLANQLHEEAIAQDEERKRRGSEMAIDIRADEGSRDLASRQTPSEFE